ncbi:hypothetical protein ACFL1Y_01140, partial [Patescibacteria group bacterium]
FNKRPDSAIIPVNVDGTKPQGNVPENAENNSGKPTAFVNNLTEIVLLSVIDQYNRDDHQNLDYISVAKLTIDPETGKLSREIICNSKSVNIKVDDWDEQVIEAVTETYFNAAKAALFLAWGRQNGKCPFWVKPIVRSEKNEAEPSVVTEVVETEETKPAPKKATAKKAKATAKKPAAKKTKKAAIVA